jgi:hypothetical protein
MVLFLIAIAAHAGSFSERVLEVRALPGACSEWEWKAASLEAPRLGYVATLDGFLSLSADRSEIFEVCNSETCSATMILGFLIPPWLEAADLTIRFPERRVQERSVEAWMQNRETGELDPILLRTTDFFGVATEDVPIGDAAYLHCGWVEIRVLIEVSVEMTDPTGPSVAGGKDVVALPKVTLGPT